MTHAKIKQAYADTVTFTYAKIVVDFCPQKEIRTEAESRPAVIFSRIEKMFSPKRRTYQH
jgi:hypothetical protein